MTPSSSCSSLTATPDAPPVVSASAPATVANVGAAFDVLGLALEAPADRVSATPSPLPGVQVLAIHGDNGLLPRDPARNAASVAATALLNHLATTHPAQFASAGCALTIEKGLPIGSGLGSSSASSAAAVVAVNALLGAPLSRIELVPFAMQGEAAACGTAHADNVAPAILGGFVLIRSYAPLDIIQLPAPTGVFVTVVTPALELRTQDARKVLKRTVPLHHAISQWGNVAALVAGIYRNDVALMGRALEDKIIEPERAQLIPGFSDVKRAALAAGAAGCSISGAGPSIFALSGSRADAIRIGEQMQAVFTALGVSASTITSAINAQGALIER